MINYIITRLLKENRQTACHFRRKKYAQIYFKWKQNQNLPRFGHVFDFDHFTKGALTQGGLHSIWKMTKTTKTCQVNYEKNSQLKQTIPLLKKSFGFQQSFWALLICANSITIYIFLLKWNVAGNPAINNYLIIWKSKQE